MGNGLMKTAIILICLVAAVAFLLISVVTTWQLFTTLLNGTGEIRGELWVLLIVAFTGGIVLLLMAWGIAEFTDMRRVQREVMLARPNTPMSNEA